jgi:hypothetical protein
MNEFDLGLKERLQYLNVFKYILNLDEAKIFEMWPSAKSRIQKVYKTSVLNVFPKNKFISETALNYSKPGSPLDFAYPHSKYFGLNFDKLSQGYLEVRYAGGAGYEKRRSDATNLINYISESVYSALSKNSEYSLDEQKKINDIMKSQKEKVGSLKTYENFKKSFKDIELLVDLKDDPRIIESNYENFRESLFDLITFGNMKKGMVNLDTKTSRIA